MSKNIQLERLAFDINGRTIVRAPAGYPGKKYQDKYVYEHRAVWWLHKGALPPKGYHIHHINHDKTDNRIENLDAISSSEHVTHHMRDLFGEPKSKINCCYCKKEFVRRNADIRYWKKKGLLNTFCSNTCAALDMTSKKDAAKCVNLKCCVCTIEFKIYEYEYNKRLKIGQKNIFCSKKCNITYNNRNRKPIQKKEIETIKLNCKHCNNEYLTPKLIYERKVAKGKTKFYCCMQCSSNDRAPAITTKMICNYCTNEFIRPLSIITAQKKKGFKVFYCNRKCQAESIKSKSKLN